MSLNLAYMSGMEAGDGHASAQRRAGQVGFTVRASRSEVVEVLRAAFSIAFTFLIF